MMWNGIGGVGNCMLGGNNMLLWIIVIGFFGWLIYTKTNFFNVNKDQDAMNILKKRFANGEISKEDYNEMKSELEKN